MNYGIVNGEKLAFDDFNTALIEAISVKGRTIVNLTVQIEPGTTPKYYFVLVYRS